MSFVQSLPLEVKTEILKHVPLAGLVNMNLVADFDNVIEARCIWENINLDDVPVLTDAFVNLLIEHSKYVKTLEWHSSPWNSS